jgi:hypothetical protein
MDERAVAAQVRVLQHFRKIADGLVGVYAEQEGDGLGHYYKVLSAEFGRVGHVFVPTRKSG